MCGSRELAKVLDLGEMPLANAFLSSPDEPELKYPLRVAFCRKCSAVQLMDIVDPNIVFKEYEYLTSASQPLSDHFIQMGKDLADEFTEKCDLVVEIGGNDGVLLEAIKDRKVLNVEPARVAGNIARQNGVPTLDAFFSSDVARTILEYHGHPKLVIANNVMAHIEDLRDVFEGIKILLDDGVFVFEVHWVGNLIKDGGFDQIYHEHLYYHSLYSLRQLVQSAGMDIFSVEIVPIHGKSLRVYASKTRTPDEGVERFIEHEMTLGLHRESTYSGFFDDIHSNKMDLKRVLSGYNKVVGYGAPAKGNTLLNYFDIDLYYIVDTTPGKQGKYTPGKHIKVYPPEQLLDDPPDAILILAWNYAETIKKKARFLGVPFIIPVPRVVVE